VTRARWIRFASLATAAAAVATMMALPSTASADRVRVRVGGRGEVRVRGRAHVRIGGPRVYGPRVYGPRVYGPRYRYRPYRYRYVRPHIYVRPYPYFYPYWGFRYAAPPPPPGCYAECGPSVSAHYYHQPQPVAVAAVAAPEPELPRLGLGIFGGSVDVENNDAGTDLGLIGRVRLTHRFVLEAEVSKTELADGARVDRRVGGALLFDFSPYNALSPYVLGGGGFGQTDVNDGTFTAEQAYAELGVGLHWTLGRHIALFGDLRAGVRESNASEDEIAFLRNGPDDPNVDDNERFTRARVGALLTF
jgi:hypothetical protein